MEHDSNALIMPARKKNSEKRVISHPQLKKCDLKRNLAKKKLTEEKKIKGAQLLSDSLKTFQKHMINEQVLSILHSSQSIGRAETKREKRRRNMQLSKVGFEALDCDPCPKRRKGRDVDVQESHELELAGQSSSLQDVALERAAQVDFGVPNTSNVIVEKVANEDTYNGMPPDTENSRSFHFSSDLRTETCEEKPSGVNSPKVECRCVPKAVIAPRVIPVSRSEEVETCRQNLPIIMMEQEIMEAIGESNVEHNDVKHNDVVIICGDTGCGKTTQVPQFLYEAGYGSNGIIGITQPRRVAVLSTAQRVAKELGVRLGEEVGFQVRHDKKIGENCALKFMTEGILLQELKSDILLKRYSVIIVDEAHERSLNTDILIALLSRVNNARKIMPMLPLKLILMSATLRMEDFTTGKRIFRNPNCIEVPTRQHPIKIHNSKKTELVNYIDKAYKMVLEIHKNRPPGGILVFVTGQREVEELQKMLEMASKRLMKRNNCETHTENETAKKSEKEAFNSHVSSSDQQSDSQSCHSEDSDSDDSCSTEELRTGREFLIGSDDKDVAEPMIPRVDGKPHVNLDLLEAAFGRLEKSGPMNMDGEKEINSMTPDVCSDKSPTSLNKEKRGATSSEVGPMCILPLYAMLPAADQLRVFKEVKEGVRKVVVSTNVAETSLTIPGITYVVDTGREKVKNYNSSNGMVSYDIQWISQASADQRAGRAGRTGPGNCERLYSAAAFGNEFPKFSCPEISKVPLDGAVLLLKSIGIKKVQNFPLPTLPDASAFAEADLCLKTLGALDDKSNLTTLGRVMAQYPISPRASKFLCVAIQLTKERIGSVRPYLVLAYAVATAAALDLPNTFGFKFEGCQTYDKDMEQDSVSGSFGSHREANQKNRRINLPDIRSDALTAAFGLHRFEHSEDKPRFCKDNRLHLHTMKEMHKLRKQLLKLVYDQRCSSMEEKFTWTLGPDKDNDWMTVPSDKYPLRQTEEDILCEAICAGWADRVAKRDSKSQPVAYQVSTMDKKTKVYLGHWSCVNKSAPEYLVYTEMLDTKKRNIIHGATKVEPKWLVKHAGSLCTNSELSSEDHKPVYDPHSDQMLCFAVPHFGRHRWELPLVKVRIKDVEQRVTAFAFALLAGNVLPCLKSVQKYLSASPSIILKPEAQAHRRVGLLLRILMSGPRLIDSCCMLREAWKDNPLLLHSEILDWFQVGFHSSFQGLWENMLSEALLAPPDRLPHT